MTDFPTFWQLRFSDYDERARWALDFKGVPHRRRSSLPVLHAFRAVRMTRKRTMPILVLDGATIRDSARIIDALETRDPEPALYPADAAARRRALDFEEVRASVSNRPGFGSIDKMWRRHRGSSAEVPA